MNFQKASEVKIPYGNYRGRTIDQVAQDEAGLKYLDRLVDDAGKIAWVEGELLEAIETYLADPIVAEDLEKVINNTYSW